ncbi:Kinesin-associated protein 3 [Toxocara canis]|uniref:Kinesin-associated protein 3 n=1 Tax=Toxocara canis TaxID=6265 RepID=A0A0B2V0J2_TOXCA|nr:Kinesin-associated protein 3 [Toxocara canis]
MDEKGDEEAAHFLKRKVKNIELDAHCTETAVIVRYEMEAAVLDSDTSTLASHSKHYQKIIRLKDLNEGVDITALARYVLERCPIIPEYRVVELEQILYYLQKRQQLTTSETLIGALSRVLRDDWKKSFELATNIVSIFSAFSSYTQFQSIVAHYKVGALCMQIIEYELKRSSAWSAEVGVSDERTARKLNLAIRKQQQLIASCVNLLMNLADDVKVELKMVHRDIVLLLSKCITDKEANVDLLIAAVQFLLKLSIFADNRDAMVAGHVVDSLCALFPIENGVLRRNVIRVLFNLSFDVSLRNQMVSAGLVSHIAPLIDGDESALNLMYQLSINDDAKAMITFTDTIQTLMRRVLSGSATNVVKALLVNIAIEKRNAQLICGTDGRGLDLIIESALGSKDQLLLKLIRNIAAHSGSSQSMFAKWATKLLEKAKSEEEHLARAGTPSNDSFAVEYLGTVNQLVAVNWAQLAEQLSLVPWIQRKLALHVKGRGSNDLLLQVVILCGTMARQLEAARLLLPVVDQLVELLSAQQEDDEMVVQVVYVFYALITHVELSESLMGGSANVGAYLMDLMHDRNAPIRAMCDRALSLIAERSEEWSHKMDIERFRWHNAQWLEMVAEGGTLTSMDSAISHSPDIFNEVFGAEDILDDTTAVTQSFTRSSDRDF